MTKLNSIKEVIEDKPKPTPLHQDKFKITFGGTPRGGEKATGSLTFGSAA
jgi:hypothetical protein